MAFDQAGYLQAHADVSEAVASGMLESALEHFLTYGWREGRDVVVRSVAEWAGRRLSGRPP
jgi:hypothetical protein